MDTRADVMQAICDVQRPVPRQSGHRWAQTLERATDHILAQLVDLDPPGDNSRRGSDGRSVWIEPTAPRYTSEAVLAQEEAILTWAMAAQTNRAIPSDTVNRDGLDPLQADAAAAVAGHDRLVLVVGPAGAGKTRTLTAAGHDLRQQGRVVFAVAPTAKAARTVERATGIRADTVAKLLHEWQRTDRPPLPEYQLPAGASAWSETVRTLPGCGRDAAHSSPRRAVGCARVQGGRSGAPPPGRLCASRVFTGALGIGGV